MEVLGFLAKIVESKKEKQLFKEFINEFYKTFEISLRVFFLALCLIHQHLE